MLKTRLIPVLFLKNGLLVRSERFVDFRELGNPFHQLERLSDWSADELIYVDITRSGEHNLKRDDQRIKSMSNIIEILREVAKRCFMPLTFGGRIQTLEQVDEYIRNGADKVIVNSGAHKNPDLVSEIAQKYGSQCVVVGIDVREEDGRHIMYSDNGTTRIDQDSIEYARNVEQLGAGEIFLNSIDRDGMATGYDTEFIQKMVETVSIPVIACGGAGTPNDFVELMTKTNVSAVAAGNIFNFTEDAYQRAKKQLKKLNLPVR